MRILFEKIINGEKWIAPDLKSIHLFVGNKMKMFRHPRDAEDMYPSRNDSIHHISSANSYNEFPDVSFRTNLGHNWWVSQTAIHGYVVFFPADSLIPFTSNRGRKECGLCGCPTAQRRDFSDMSVHEMCPRCKV
jgi:hypothetical protein